MEHSSDIESSMAAAEQTAAAVMESDGLGGSCGLSNGSLNGAAGGVAVLRPEVPRVEVKLFAGRIPRSYTEADVRGVFAQFGEVVDAIIIRDKATGTHKGSAFIRMSSISAADAAIRELNNRKVLEENLTAMQVKYATGEAERLNLPPSAGEGGVDQAKLFVGSLPKGVTKEQVMDIFSPYGIIDEVYLMKDNATGTGKGCAFVKFHFKEEALYAIKSVDGKMTVPGCARPVEVRFAESRNQRMGGGNGGGGGAGFPSPMGANTYGGGGGGAFGGSMFRQMGPDVRASSWKEYFTFDHKSYYHNDVTKVTQWERPIDFYPPGPTMGGGLPNMGGGGSGTDQAGPAGANLYVFHCPNEWGRHDLVREFCKYGPIRSASIGVDKVTGRQKGYAFVSFEDKLSARNALIKMNGYETCGKRLKVDYKKGEEDMALPINDFTASSQSNQMNQAAVGQYAMSDPMAQQQQYGVCGFTGNRYAPY